MTHTEPSEIDPATWAERQTDAGTREYPPLRKEADPEFDYEDVKED